MLQNKTLDWPQDGNVWPGRRRRAVRACTISLSSSLSSLAIPTRNRVPRRLTVARSWLLPPLANDRRRPISLEVKCVGQERRRTPRFPFVATAEVVDTSSGTGVTARVSELSLYGCYIDMTNPLPEGTSIMVKIYSGGRHLDAAGKVVYSAQIGRAS